MEDACYIFGAGEHYCFPKIEQRAFIIAADGGYNYLASNNIKPDLLIGDFDSLQKRPDGIDIVALPVVKDYTDMAAAIKIGGERGFRCFHIYGGTGGRLDHTLANIQCLADIAQNGGRGFLFDKDCIITAICSSAICFPPVESGFISVFAHSNSASGVCENGLKYLLDNVTLNSQCPLGVSNEFIGLPSQVSVKEGILTIVYPKNVTDAIIHAL